MVEQGFHKAKVVGSSPAPDTMKTIFVYITAPSRAEARKIAKYLLDKKLIACANIHKIESLYRWKGKMADESEWVLVCKTVGKNYQKIVKETEKIHSYSVPCVIKIPAFSNDKYFKWVEKETC